MKNTVKSPNEFSMLLAVWLLFAAPVFGAEIELKDSDYPKLVGKWHGELTVDIGRVSQSAASDFTNKFRLIIMQDSTARFTDLKSGKKWKSTATINQGKLMLRFAREQRPFTYSESGGESKLSLSFERKKAGKVKKHNLELLKQ